MTIQTAYFISIKSVLTHIVRVISKPKITALFTIVLYSLYLAVQVHTLSSRIRVTRKHIAYRHVVTTHTLWVREFKNCVSKLLLH